MTVHAHQVPGVGVLRFPLSRSRMLMLFVAGNFGFLGIETLISHYTDRTVKPYEWIPVFHGPIAGLVLLWFVLRTKPSLPEIMLYLMTLASAVVVGLMGTAFHLQRAFLIRRSSPEGIFDWLVFAPPVAGPLAFAGVALLGLMAILHEEPRDSGNFDLWGQLRLQAPITKTQQLLWIVGLGYAAAALSAILDHARSSYENPAVWVAVASGVFATVVTLGRAMTRRPDRTADVLFFWTQILMVGVGLLGMGMHLSADLSGTGSISLERLISFAPVFAPMLFADLAILALIAVLHPVERV